MADEKREESFNSDKKFEELKKMFQKRGSGKEMKMNFDEVKDLIEKTEEAEEE